MGRVGDVCVGEGSVEGSRDLKGELAEELMVSTAKGEDLGGTMVGRGSGLELLGAPVEAGGEAARRGRAASSLISDLARG